MAPKYKLTYFPITGLAEGIRFLFAYGNIEFEDHRIKYEEWATIKQTTPFGKLPVLEMDGKELHQSGAICRYLAKQMGLAGKNDWESLQIDIAVDTMSDFTLKFADYYYDPNEDQRKSKYEPLVNETIPFYLSRFDKMVEENGGYLVGGQLSWADLRYVGLFHYLGKLVKMDLFKDYPNLAKMRDNVVNIPQIKEWIKKRPEDVLFAHSQ